MILDEIIAYKRGELVRRKRELPLALLRERAEGHEPALDFAAALRRPGVSLIAEVKQASPSRGLLRSYFDPARLARAYAVNGAVAISILTDERFFRGSLNHLLLVREALPSTPILRKDFVFDPYQVYETRAYGADALLLIVGALNDEELADLLALTGSLGMTALVEVHDRVELERTLSLKPEVIGINNRDLRDFTVSLEATQCLRPLIPDGVIVVSESGIRRADDMRRLAQIGVDAALIGEALVTARDLGAKVRELADFSKLSRTGEKRDQG